MNRPISEEWHQHLIKIGFQRGVFDPRQSKIGRFKKGHVSCWKGKKRAPFSKEWCRHISEGHKGKPAWNKGSADVISVCPYQNHKFVHLKSRHPLFCGRYHFNLFMNWEGREKKRKLRLDILGSYKYAKWRQNCFLRADFRCNVCLKRAKRLEIHHKHPLLDIISEERLSSLKQALSNEAVWDEKNVMVLCKGCHHKLDNFRIWFDSRKEYFSQKNQSKDVFKEGTP